MTIRQRELLPFDPQHSRGPQRPRFAYPGGRGDATVLHPGDVASETACTIRDGATQRCREKARAPARASS